MTPARMAEMIKMTGETRKMRRESTARRPRLEYKVGG